MAVIESHIDDQPFAFGTHARGDSQASLVNPGKDFKSCGVAIGMLLKNVTDGSEGTITAVTEDTVTAILAGGTDNDWDVGDEYEVYLTGIEDSFISRIYTDRSRGWKTTYPDELDEDSQWFHEDLDEDQDRCAEELRESDSILLEDYHGKSDHLLFEDGGFVLLE